jgi:hypothetical protein
VATFDQVTVTGANDHIEAVGFQTNWRDGGAIDVGAEITGGSVGVRGIADPQMTAAGTFAGPGNGIEGYGYPGSGVFGQGTEATAAPGVTGEGARASAPDVDVVGGPIGVVDGGPGVNGQGGAASAKNAATGAGQEVPVASPAGPGVIGVGGPGAITTVLRPEGGRRSALGAPGPGVIGTGGAAVPGQPDITQPAGAGIIGIAGNAQADLSQTGGYGGYFASSNQGQVQLRPQAPAAAQELVPLPANAQAGDLFARMVPVVGRDRKPTFGAELWFCSSPTVLRPKDPVLWNRVQFDIIGNAPG